MTALTTNTLNAYCSFWKEHNKKQYLLFESELAKKGLLVRFNNFLRKEKARMVIGGDEVLNLEEIPSGIRTALTKYLFLSNEEFDANIIKPYGVLSS